MLLNIEEKVLFNRGWYLGKIDQRVNKKAHPFRSELSIWWRRRELNPRPRILRNRRYMLSTFYLFSR